MSTHTDNTTPSATSSQHEATPETQTDLLTPTEASALTGRHVYSLRRYRRQGKLRAFRVLGLTRYLRADLIALIEPVEMIGQETAKQPAAR